MDAFEKLCEQVKEKFGLPSIPIQCTNVKEAIKVLGNMVAIMHFATDRYDAAARGSYEAAINMFKDYDEYCDAYFNEDKRRQETFGELRLLLEQWKANSKTMEIYGGDSTELQLQKATLDCCIVDLEISLELLTE